MALIVLVTPGAALVPVLIVISLLLVGGLYFLGMLMFDRKSLWDRARRHPCHRGPELRICALALVRGRGS